MTGLMVKNDTTVSSFHTNRPGMSPLMIMLKTDMTPSLWRAWRARWVAPTDLVDLGQTAGVAHRHRQWVDDVGALPVEVGGVEGESRGMYVDLSR